MRPTKTTFREATVADDLVRLTAPASKSASHRYIIAAALAPGVSRVRHVLESRDLERTRAILCAAGAVMRPLADADGWEVRGLTRPQGGSDADGALSCDVHESGTTCRLLTAVLAAGQGFFRIHGADRMHERPVGDLVRILSALGADIRYEGQPGCPPLLLRARGLDPALCGGAAAVPMDVSSQYFSGLLLAAPLARAPLVLEVAGDKAVSWPYVGLTLQCLEDFGLEPCLETREHPEAEWEASVLRPRREPREAKPGCLRVRMKPAHYKAGDYSVEGDWSGASYLLAAGAVGRRPVRVDDLRLDSLQGDRAILDLLRSMGAKVEVEEGVGTGAATVFPSRLKAVEADMSACPDIVPTLAVLAAFAEGTSRLHNVAHLRVKESDRIAAPAAELRKVGVSVEDRPDGLVVRGLYPEKPHPDAETRFSAHNDHRIAMSLALLGLPGRTNAAAWLDDPDVVAKSFPDFWNVWSKVL